VYFAFPMDATEKMEFLAAAQREIMRHVWDCFVQNPPSIARGGKGTVVPGCTACEKIIYTNTQYLSHIALDVLPQIIDRVLSD
jgi:hypothetical protein